MRNHQELMLALNQHAGMITGNKGYMSMYEFVLQKGRMWTPAPLPKGIRMGENGRCFETCQKLAKRKGLRYVEGFALGASPIITLHAWCVDEEDRVIEVIPVWAAHENSYFGVAFDIKDVERQIAGNKQTISVIDNWEKRYPLLKRSTANLIGQKVKA